MDALSEFYAQFPVANVIKAKIAALDAEKTFLSEQLDSIPTEFRDMTQREMENTVRSFTQ